MAYSYVFDKARLEKILGTKSRSTTIRRLIDASIANRFNAYSSGFRLVHAEQHTNNCNTSIASTSGPTIMQTAASNCKNHGETNIMDEISKLDGWLEIVKERVVVKESGKDADVKVVELNGSVKLKLRVVADGKYEIVDNQMVKWIEAKLAEVDNNEGVIAEKELGAYDEILLQEDEDECEEVEACIDKLQRRITALVEDERKQRVAAREDLRKAQEKVLASLQEGTERQRNIGVQLEQSYYEISQMELAERLDGLVKSKFYYHLQLPLAMFNPGVPASEIQFLRDNAKVDDISSARESLGSTDWTNRGQPTAIFDSPPSPPAFEQYLGSNTAQ
ncbi:hypothetical protein HDU76_001545 [Blyttiomyces sp. JEL0837]|nr:hypothetical protein HDU76_001545 [Blyttiomyces sp. JEL0837]